MISIPVSPGELIDKITILRIRISNTTDATKRSAFEKEHNDLAGIYQVVHRAQEATPALEKLEDELFQINQTLWSIEDAIRECESKQDFGPGFIELARSVYKTNDRRSKVKSGINTLLNSLYLEEKSYTQY